uniref:Cytochrome P450 n=1 Tax=Ornithorhynchus anatinus TaxID=9258 RepID=A0A6I8NHY9_ORNAN
GISSQLVFIERLVGADDPNAVPRSPGPSLRAPEPWGGLPRGRGKRRQQSFVSKLRDKYGPVYTVYLGPRPVVVLCGLDAVKEALVDKAEEFSGRGKISIIDKIFQGYGVAFSNGQRWKTLRRFSLATLRDFGMGKRSIEERIQEEAQCLVEEIHKTEGELVDPTFFFNSVTSNIICSIVFGNRFDYRDKMFLTLLSIFNETFTLMSSPWGQLFELFSGIMKYLPGVHRRVHSNLEYVNNFITQRVESNKKSLDPNSPRDFIDCFLIRMDKEKETLGSEFHMRNLVLTTQSLFFAGTETSSTTLRYSFLLMLKYPQVAEKVQEEIDQVIGQDRPPGLEDRTRMPYTDAVIHEIQRFSDLLPLGVPHIVTQDTHFRGYFLPKGTDVYPLLSSVLHDPRHFKRPDSFDPGHFLDARGNFKKSEAFLPFSTGKRICLGESIARMELFLFFTTVLQNFSLASPVAPEDIDLTPRESGIGKVAPPYQLRFLPR